MAKTFNKKNWIIYNLRRSTLRYPPANKARNKAKTVYYITSKKGTQVKRVKYTCQKCFKTDLKSSEVELDHNLPVVDPAVGFVDFNTYIERMFCDEDGYTLLCIPCHEAKTAQENTIRQASKK